MHCLYGHTPPCIWLGLAHLRVNALEDPGTPTAEAGTEGSLAAPPICPLEPEVQSQDQIPRLLVLIRLLSWLCVGFNVTCKQYLLFPTCCLKYLLRQYAPLWGGGRLFLSPWILGFDLFLIRKFPHKSDFEAHTQNDTNISFNKFFFTTSWQASNSLTA